MKNYNFSGKQISSNKISFVLLLIVSVLSGIAITVAFFFASSFTSGFVGMSGKVLIEAVGEGEESIEDTETCNLVVDVSKHGVLIPGMDIKMPANVKVYRSTTSPLLRAKLEIFYLDPTTEEVKTDELNIIQDMYLQLCEVIDNNDWYLHSDGYFYYVGNNDTSLRGDSILKEVVVSADDVVIDFINEDIVFPTWVTREYSGFGVKFKITFQAIQNYIPDDNGHQVANTITNSLKIFDAFDDDNITTISLESFDISYNGNEVIIGAKEGVEYPESFALPKVDADDKQITTISNSFANNKTLQNIFVPDGYTTIEEGAFANTTLRTIDLSKTSITQIPDNCFSSSRLQKVLLPNTLEGIGDNAFNNNTNLFSINLPDTLKSIGSGALFGTGIRVLNIPASVTSIASESIYSPYLTSIIVDDENANYYDIDDCAIVSNAGVFNTLASLYQTVDDSFTIPNGVHTLDKSSILYTSFINKLVFPTSLSTINTNAISDNIKTLDIPSGNSTFSAPTGKELIRKSNGTLIKYIYQNSSVAYTIPDDVRIIADFAFQTPDFENTPAITRLTISKNVTTVNNQAFKQAKINEISISGNTTYSTISGKELIKSNNTLIHYSATCTDKTYDIPTGITNINSYAFNYNDFIEKINLNTSLTQLSGYSFYYCSSLKFINNLTSSIQLGEHLIDGSNIDVFTVFSSSVPSELFCSVPNLKKVIFLEYVTSIADSCIVDCAELRSVVFEKTTPPSFASPNLHSGTTPNNFKIYVPDSSISSYKSIVNLSQYTSNIFGISQMQ